MKYENWLDHVDAAILRETDGIVDRADLPDLVSMWDLYVDEFTPREAAIEVLQENGFDFDGFDFDDFDYFDPPEY